MKLENKVAIVTGAGRGIGKAVVTRLAEEGASVIVSDVDLAFAENAAEKLKVMGRETSVLMSDVSKWQGIVQCLLD